MQTTIKIIATLAALYGINAHADAKLTYVLDGPDMQPQTKQFSISHFFARIEDAAEADTFLLYQAGKFFPLYRVNATDRSYTRLTPEVKPTLRAGIRPQEEVAKKEAPAGQTDLTVAKQALDSQPVTPPKTATSTQAAASAASATEATKAQATPDLASDDAAAAVPATEVASRAEESVSAEAKSPASTVKADPAPAAEPSEPKAAAKPDAKPQEPPKTTLRLTKKNTKIAGIACRQVVELVGDEPVMTHCMADKARLGITEREIRTLARTFEMAREREFGWLGTATQDENFVSIASEDLKSKKTLKLHAVSTAALPTGHLRIPREFKQVQD